MTATLEIPSQRTSRRATSRRVPKHEIESASGATVIALRTLYAISGLMIWALVYALLFGALQETRSQNVLYSQFRQQLAEETAPAGGAIGSAKPVALLEIPNLGVRDVVVEGTSASDLLLGPGHRADSPLPGEIGVSVLYGRGATFGAPFRRLVKLRPGDSITMVDGIGTFHYVVDDIRHAGSLLPKPLSAGSSRLTLASVSGTGWRADWAPSSPFYVDATMRGTALAEPGGRVAEVSPTDKLMASDTGALSPLVRWLQLFGLVAVGAAWMYSRWGRWQTWLVAVPTLGAVLWLVSETAVKLLPNVL